MVLMKNFNIISNTYLLLYHKTSYHILLLRYLDKVFQNHDIFYDEMVLMFFMNTIANPRKKVRDFAEVIMTQINTFSSSQSISQLF